MSATRAGWPSSRTRAAPSSRPGRRPGWAASRRTAPNAFGWADLNARGVDRLVPFYTKVFGWQAKAVGTPEQPYTEFAIDGGELRRRGRDEPQAPAGMPNYWMVYFSVDDVDAAYLQAVSLGGHEMLAPIDFPGGRLAFITDPQGAAFGIMTYQGS